MTFEGRRWPTGRLAMTLCVLTLLAIGSREAFADAHCHNVRGRITIQALTGPACISPVGLCLAGTLVGALRGDYRFTASALIPSADTPLTGVFFSTGDSELETPGGTLFTKDALALATSGAGEFSDLSIITGGTGDGAGAFGTITITGAYGAGQGEAVYAGEVCTP
jgi:hypothetical protein